MIHTLFLHTELSLEAFNDEASGFFVSWKKEVGQSLGELHNTEGKVIARLTLFDDGKFILLPLSGYEKESKDFLSSPVFSSLAKGTLSKYADKQLRALKKSSFSFDDEEALHDYRIALRKTRTILASFSLGLSKKQRAFWKTTFRKLGLLTSSVRDLDVLYAQLTKDAVDPQVLEVLLKERKKAMHKLVSSLQDPSYALLLDQWEAVLQSSITICASYDLERTIEEQKIRLHRAIKVANRAETDQALHQVRKEGKKLRYLRDISNLDSSPVLDEVHELLGAYHDLGVLQQWLFWFLKQHKKRIPSLLKTHLLQLVVTYEGKRATLLEHYRLFVIPLMEV